MRALLVLFSVLLPLSFATAQDKLQVVSSFSILADMTRQVGGEHIQLSNMVGLMMLPAAVRFTYSLDRKGRPPCSPRKLQRDLARPRLRRLCSALWLGQCSGSGMPGSRYAQVLRRVQRPALTTYAQLNPSHAQRVIAITDTGDRIDSATGAP